MKISSFLPLTEGEKRELLREFAGWGRVIVFEDTVTVAREILADVPVWHNLPREGQESAVRHLAGVLYEAEV